MKSVKIMRSFKLSDAHIPSWEKAFWELPKPKTGETFKCLYLKLTNQIILKLTYQWSLALPLPMIYLSSLAEC